MQERIIVGVNLLDRIHEAPEFQKILTDYGCNIKTRLGLHEVDEKMCSTSGLILLELFGDDRRCQELIQKLEAFEQIEVRKMVFTRP